MSFIDVLKKKKILKDDLTDGNLSTKYMGFIKLKKNPVAQ